MCGEQLQAEPAQHFPEFCVDYCVGRNVGSPGS